VVQARAPRFGVTIQQISELSRPVAGICNESCAGPSNREMTRGIELVDDGLLLRRMIAGDEESFTQLYRRRHPAIYRFALHMSGNCSVAEDVTQEVFMTLIRDAKRFDPERGTLGGFLFGIARNHLRRRWEQERNSVPLPESADELDQIMARDIAGRLNGNGASSNGHGHRNGNGNGNGALFGVFPMHRDDLVSQENVIRVRQAIATLPENYREVVVLCELDEMSYEEAAAALECPVGTVRSRLHRARALLLEKLRDAQPVRRASAVG
jgi:RNA polymerase sigma-70 factor, ECF subfamily